MVIDHTIDYLVGDAQLSFVTFPWNIRDVAASPFNTDTYFFLLNQQNSIQMRDYSTFSTSGDYQFVEVITISVPGNFRNLRHLYDTKFMTTNNISGLPFAVAIIYWGSK